MLYSTELNALLDEIQAILLSILIKLGPFAVALMPALFTAYAIFHTFKEEAGTGLAFAFAVVVGLAFETVGIVATHTAIDLYNGWQGGAIKPVKFWLMVALVPLYVLGVAGVVFFSDGAFTPLVRSLGVASPFLTCVVYVAVALARDLSKIELKEEGTNKHSWQVELEEKRHRQALELKRMDLEQAKELKRIEADAQVQIEQAKAEARVQMEQAQVETERARELPELEPVLGQSYHCANPGCSASFKTKQALGAHQRFCEGVKVNGNGKH